jgi:hypothetical protein
MSVRFFLFLAALLTLLPPRASAFDPEVSAELERITRDPTNTRLIILWTFETACF